MQTQNQMLIQPKKYAVINNTNDQLSKWFKTADIDEIINFVKPTGLYTEVFVVELAYTRNNSSTTGGFSRNKGGTPLITLFVDKTPDYEYPCFVEHRCSRIVIHKDFLIQDENGEIKVGVGQRSAKHFRKNDTIPIGRRYYNAKGNERDKYFQDTKGYLNYMLLSEEEDLILTLAHEFRHFWQKNHPGKRGRVWGAKGKNSERDADAYGIRKLREWRAIYSPRDFMEGPGSCRIPWEMLESQMWLEPWGYGDGKYD